MQLLKPSKEMKRRTAVMWEKQRAFDSAKAELEEAQLQVIVAQLEAVEALSRWKKRWLKWRFPR